MTALDLLASLVLESGARWGEVATADQWADAAAILDPDGPPYHFVTRARGYSKTADLAAVALSVMVAELPPGSRLYGLAAAKDQARLLVDSLSGFVLRTPEIGAHVDGSQYKVTTRSGCVLEVLSADDASAWGLRPSFLVVDEIAQWQSTPGPRRLWEAVSSAVVKVPGARLVVLTSAGDPAHWSYQVLEHARSDGLWRTHEIVGPPPWADPARLAEQRRRLPESSWRRLFANEWTAGEDRLTTLESLRACVVLDGPQEPKPGRRYVVGLDVGLVADRTVAAVCHVERGVVHLDRLQVWAGSRQSAVQLSVVEAWLVEVARRYAPEIVADPWQSVGLCQRLRAKGLRVREFVFGAQSVGRLATALHVALRDHRLALFDDEALIDELAHVRLRESSPGVTRMDHDAGRHDDRAIALALAVHRLLDRPQGGNWAQLFGATVCAVCGAVSPENTAVCRCGAILPASPEPVAGGWAGIYTPHTMASAKQGGRLVGLGRT